jgi:aspartate kinase
MTPNTTSVLVKKFGGTSVGSIERIQNVVDRILRDRDAASDPAKPPVLVVSAMSGDTNRLVGLGEQVFPHYRGPAYDMLVASGEQVSVALVAMAFAARGVSARPYLAHQLGIQTDSSSSKARIQRISTDGIMKDIQAGVIPVVAGFQGVDELNQVTTLGRGGSDTTAVALAAALGQKECEIYTDVPAVFSADPRLVPAARELSKISFEEMMEMASLGSKVLHIRSVEIAAKYGVRIHLRSTFEDRVGTWVVPEGEIMEQAAVVGITHDEKIGVLELEDLPAGLPVLAEIFEKLASRSIVVDIITQSQRTEKTQRLSFSVSSEDLPMAVEILKTDFPQVQLKALTQVSKVSAVGVGMRNHPGVAAKFFRVLADLEVPILLTTTSEIKVSAVIPSAALEKSARRLHAVFGLE